MSGSIFNLPKAIGFAAGVVVPGAQLRFFLSGTSTPTDSYQDITLSTPHAVPVEADSGGIFPVIYLSPYITYRVRLSDSAATQIYQVDNVTSQAAESTEYRVKHTAPAVIWEETDASANNGKWRIVANSEVWSIQTGNDAESWTTRISMTRAAAVSLTGTLAWGGGAAITDSDDVAQGSTGSFTMTLTTGCSTQPTTTCNYRTANGIVTLTFAATLLGTSNATTLVIGGIPAGIRPSALKTLSTWAYDNGDEVAALAVIQTDGTIVFGMGAGFSATGFTGSGTKGFSDGWTLVYPQ